jgi:hypothetical protein
MFNATTPFDWYVVQNSKNEGFSTIKFEDNVIKINDDVIYISCFLQYNN